MLACEDIACVRMKPVPKTDAIHVRMQITASVTFLPLLSDPCTFDLLVYTDTSSDVPLEWCACVKVVTVAPSTTFSLPFLFLAGSSSKHGCAAGRAGCYGQRMHAARLQGGV